MDNLENFFRDRAQRHNLEFNEGDWRKLESQLDKEFPVAFSFWALFKKFWYTPLLLLIIPITWFAISNSERPNQTSSENDIFPNQTAKADIEGFREKKIEEIYIDQKATFKTENFKTTESISSADGIHNSSSTNANTNEPAITEKNLKNVNAIISNTRHEYMNQKSYAVFENGAESKGQILDSKLHFLFPIPPNSSIASGEVPMVINHEPLSVIERNEKSKSYFSFGLGYSPDFSTVGIGNFIAPGSRWNILIEYSFLNRLSINSGVVLVNNKYETYGEDYHAPSRYWKKGIVASEAYGECKMVDIPLNIRYDVFSNHRHNFFVSAGASTYFVLKEDYYFKYEYDDPDLPNHWGTEKMTTYPFGIINTSIGYEYQIGKKSALQVEPFFKIPTTGIGWGNVNLHTFGMYFMYKYRVVK